MKLTTKTRASIRSIVVGNTITLVLLMIVVTLVVVNYDLTMLRAWRVCDIFVFATATYTGAQGIAMCCSVRKSDVCGGLGHTAKGAALCCGFLIVASCVLIATRSASYFVDTKSQLLMVNLASVLACLCNVAAAYAIMRRDEDEEQDKGTTDCYKTPPEPPKK